MILFGIFTFMIGVAVGIVAGAFIKGEIQIINNKIDKENNE